MIVGDAMVADSVPSEYFFLSLFRRLDCDKMIGFWIEGHCTHGFCILCEAFSAEL